MTCPETRVQTSRTGCGSRSRRERARACRRPERRPRFGGRRAPVPDGDARERRLRPSCRATATRSDERDAELVGHHFDSARRPDRSRARVRSAGQRSRKRCSCNCRRPGARRWIPGVATARVPLANMKARLRMSSLYFIANSLNYLVAGTGNRSELTHRLLHQVRRRRGRSAAARQAAEERGPGARARSRDPAVDHRQAAERRPLGGPDGRRRDGLLLRRSRTLPDERAETRRPGARDADRAAHARRRNTNARSAVMPEKLNR